MKKGILKTLSIAAIFSLAYLNFSLDIKAESGDLKLDQLKASANCESWDEYDPHTSGTYQMVCCPDFTFVCEDNYGVIVAYNYYRFI